jgi:assimilatory nitrate reductase catalytic subunit
MRDGSPIKTTCPYCGVGCGVLATPQANGQVAIIGDPEHPANFGRLCSKGTALGQTIDLEGRLLAPKLNGKETNWDNALDFIAERLTKTIQKHGPDAVGFYLSGQMLTEDYYVANKLMKGFIGSANVDTNSRLCMSSTVAGHKRAFGADTVPGTYEDLEHADLVVLVGSNMAWCHPVLFQRILAAKEKRPGLNLVVIDPRRTKTAEMANLHLQVKPDGDVALFNGLLQHIVTTQMVNTNYVDAHTEGFAEAVSAAQISRAELIKRTGLSSAALDEFFSLFVNTEKVVTCFSQGVKQSATGTDKVNAILNCHLATGRIGRKGMGPFSLTGQPNAMGGREVGGLANMLAAHMDIENPNHRDLVQQFWGAPNLAPKPGLKAVDLFRALKKGRIKALWIMGTNPMVSMPDSASIAAALKKCPLVITSDSMAQTPTTDFAHVQLPALGWGEKSGTVTNSERRISRQRAFLPAPGEAKPDWWHMAEVAKRMGFAADFSYQTARDIFVEHAQLSGHQNDGTRDFDIGAYADISTVDYDALPPFQWPQPKDAEASTTRFFANGSFYTPNRRAKFVPTRIKTPILRGLRKTTRLNTGRVRDQWHTMTRTGKAESLNAHIAEPYCELSEITAVELGIAPAQIVEISAGKSSIFARALISEKVRPGEVFVPMHWNSSNASLSSVNQVVKVETDPFSGQPALKSSKVKIKPAHMVAFGFALLRSEPKNLGFDYWAKAKCPGGWRVEFAHGGALTSALIEQLTGLPPKGADVKFKDAKASRERMAWFDGNLLRSALFLASEPVEVSRSWAVEQFSADYSEMRKRYQLVAGRPGADQPDPGPIVCSCFSVGANQILEAAANGCTSVEAIGEKLSAGTNCGSCKAEISELIHERPLLAAE